MYIGVCFTFFSVFTMIYLSLSSLIFDVYLDQKLYTFKS